MFPADVATALELVLASFDRPLAVHAPINALAQLRAAILARSAPAILQSLAGLDASRVLPLCSHLACSVRAWLASFPATADAVDMAELQTFMATTGATRWAEVQRADRMSDYLVFIKELLMARLVHHSRSSKSSTVDTIHNVCGICDELLFHLENKDIKSFLVVYQQLIDTDNNSNNVRRAVHQTSLDSSSVARYREMVYQVYRAFLRKVSAFLKSLVEAQREKLWTDVLAKVTELSEAELARLDQEVKELVTPETSLGMFT